MPLYDYDCAACGPFKEWGAMSTATDPQTCPQCRAPAERALAAPHFRCGGADVRYKAEAFNERSANEPKMVRHMGEMGQHDGRDGHRHHAHAHARGQLQKSDRPWMIGH